MRSIIPYAVSLLIIAVVVFGITFVIFGPIWEAWFFAGTFTFSGWWWLWWGAEKLNGWGGTDMPPDRPDLMDYPSRWKK